MSRRSSVPGAVPLVRTAVIGMRERGGKSIAQPIVGTDGKTLRTAIEQRVAPGATVYTGEHRGYNALAGYSRGTSTTERESTSVLATSTSTQRSRCGRCSSVASMALGITLASNT